jgi:hypothetical protein
MSEEKNQAPAANSWQPKEHRYTLRVLLEEVATERQIGAIGHEKLRQNVISPLFHGKTRKRSDAGN